MVGVPLTIWGVSEGFLEFAVPKLTSEQNQTWGWYGSSGSVVVQQ